MEKERRESIGATIRTLREARGVSRQELATAAGISAEMVAKVEQGRKAPSASTLAAIAGALGLEAPDLAHRASAWQALAAAGESLAALRAGTIAGTLGRGAVGAGGVAGLLAASYVAPIGVAAAGAYALHREMRNRRVVEEMLRSSLFSREDVADVADSLGVPIPVENLDGELDG